jgi:hypothetical protein
VPENGDSTSKKILKMKISPFGPSAAQRLRLAARAPLNRELSKNIHKSWQPPMNNAVAGPTAGCRRVIPVPHQDGLPQNFILDKSWPAVL